MTHFKRSLMPVVGLLTVSLAACGSDPVNPDKNATPGLHIVAGANVTDTIDARLPQALMVEVRLPDGKVARGVEVKFESLSAADTTRKDRASYVCKTTAQYCGPNTDGVFTPISAYDTTDANGRAKAMVRLARVAGRVVIRLSVESLSLLDSAAYTVTPGAPTQVRAATADTIINIGATATLRGRVLDRYDNPRTETVAYTVSTGTAVTLNASTAVVTGQEMGSQRLYARYNNFVDSTTVVVTPVARLVAYAINSSQVRLLNTNGSDVRVLASNVFGTAPGVYPHFDQTRQRITFHAISVPSIGVFNTTVMDTSGAPRRDFGPGTNFVGMMTSRLLADGTIMLVGYRLGPPDFAVWRVSPDNSFTFVVIPPGLLEFRGGADFSADGSKIVYQSLTDLPADIRIYEFASKSVKTLVVGARSPRWSPQGDRVAFLPGFGKGVGIINADGTGQRVIGNTALSTGLNWSPDGAYIIGRSDGVSNAPCVVIVRVSDGAEILLRYKNATGAFEDYYQPDWR